MLAFAALMAAAQAGGGNAPQLVEALAACRQITSESERLGCYDRAAAALATARERGDVVVLDRDGMRQAKRRLFGFSQPRQSLFSDGPDDGAREPRIEAIESTLTRTSPVGNGRHLLVLADGTHWQTTETRSGFFPRTGDAIKVEAGILGSYNARVGRANRSIKVKRVQ